MKIKVAVSMGLIGCRREAIIEVENDASDDEIEETAREVLFGSMIEWSWEKVE